MAGTNDGQITFNAADVYQRLTLFTGAAKSMVATLQQQNQWPLANQLEQLIAQYGISNGGTAVPASPPRSHTEPAVRGVGRPPGQQQPAANSGQFGSKAKTAAKR